MSRCTDVLGLAKYPVPPLILGWMDKLNIGFIWLVWVCCLNKYIIYRIFSFLVIQKIINHLRKNSHSGVYASSMSVPVIQQTLSSMRIIMGEDGTNEGTLPCHGLQCCSE